MPRSTPGEYELAEDSEGYELCKFNVYQAKLELKRYGQQIYCQRMIRQRQRRAQRRQRQYRPPR